LTVQPKIVHQKPVGFNSFTNMLANLILKLIGWSYHLELPPTSKFIIVGAPHTSNWDWVLMLLVTRADNLRLHWAAKDSAFKGILGPVMRSLGGIPINRRERTSMVDQVVDMFSKADEFILAITPEGTRSKVKAWKSGFYHIAMNAQVPILLAALDGKNRRIVGDFILYPSGDIRADMEIIRKYYKGKQGINPHLTSEPRLAIEIEEGQEPS
jgi:1-acyl-sn-glycerol-3-phosphate acyltransferase